MSESNKSVRLLFFIGACLVVFVVRLPVSVRGLEDNEQIVDDFDTGTATYWQGLQVVNDSTTFWHLSTHGELLPPGIDLMRPPSEEGDGFIEVFPVSDSPARIFSNVFDLLPGATVEMTYWNFDAIYPSVRNAVLLLYKELKQLDDDTGIEPPLMTVLVYSAPISNDPSLGWITVPIDLKIKEPSKIQLRIDGYIGNSSNTGMAVSKIAIKNGLEVSTTSTSSTLTPTETSTVGSTIIQSTTELTTTRTSLSSKSPTLIPTTITSSAMSSTLSTTTVLSSSTSISSSIPSFILSTTTSSTVSSTSSPSSISSTSPTVYTTSTMPPPPGASTNQLRDILIGVGVSILLFFLFCLLFILCYKRHRRRAYLIENRQLEAGIIRQLKQFDHNPSLPYQTVNDRPSISSTNLT